MNIEQLTGRYFRLRNELAAAYGLVPWNTGHIDRLTDELAETERQMAAVSFGYVLAARVQTTYTDSPRVGSN